MDKNILLVEDNDQDEKLILRALRKVNLANQVDVARDGQQALDYLYRRGPFADRPAGNPALILLDLKMPLVSGLEVLREIKQDEELRHVPVVMLTSSREERDLDEAYDLGCNAYVVKPVNFHDFIDAVKSLGLFWAVLNEPPPGCVHK